MKSLSFIFSLVTTSLVLISNSVQAQDEFEKVEILDAPRYSLTKKFTLDADLTFLPLDAFYKPLLLEGALSYQLNDFISLEAVRFGWSVYNHDTGLTKSTQAAANAAAGSNNFRLYSNQELNNLRYRVGSTVYANVLYSKSNFFNQVIVYHYWQVGAGVMYYDMDKVLRKARNGVGNDYFQSVNQVGLELSLKVRFFINERWLVNFRAGHTIGFNTDAPNNIFSVGAGAGLAF